MLFDGLLQKGEAQTFQDAQKVDLILGNAGAIELYVNGKKIENKFEDGQVERLSYTKETRRSAEPAGRATLAAGAWARTK